MEHDAVPAILRKADLFVMPSRNDTAALRERIINYTRNSELLTAQGHRSRQIAEQMSWKRVAQEYKKSYERINE